MLVMGHSLIRSLLRSHRSLSLIQAPFRSPTPVSLDDDGSFFGRQPSVVDTVKSVLSGEFVTQSITARWDKENHINYRCVLALYSSVSVCVFVEQFQSQSVSFSLPF